MGTHFIFYSNFVLNFYNERLSILDLGVKQPKAIV